MRFSLRDLLILMLFAALLFGAAGQTWFKPRETAAWSATWPSLGIIAVPMFVSLFVSVPQRLKIRTPLFRFPNRGRRLRWTLIAVGTIQPVIIGVASGVSGESFALILAVCAWASTAFSYLIQSEVVFGAEGVYGYGFAPWDVRFIKLNPTSQGDFVVFQNTASIPVPDEYRERVRAVFQEKLGGF